MSEGQKSRLTKEGNTIICKTNNIVPLVVPRLSFNLESSSFSVSRNSRRSASSSSSGAVLERGDGIARGNRCDPWKKNETKNKKRDDMENSGDPLTDPQAKLKEFTDHLEDTELRASEHSSENSDWECLTKVTTKMKEAQYLYSFLLRIKITKSAYEPKWQGLFPKDALTKLFSVRKYGDLILIDHKVV